jgi:putative ABC transport system permease protein
VAADRDWKTLVRSRIAPLQVDAARAADIVDELALHVAEHYADLVAAGLPPEEALDRALAPLTGPERISRELARADRPRPSAIEPPADAAGGAWLVDVARDARYAARLLKRAPAFAAVAIVTLALGIAANTTIFSVLRAVLLRPLPFSDPERLVYVGDQRDSGVPGNTGFSTFVDWRNLNQTFDDLAIVRSWAPTLIANGEPERLNGMRVSANFFRLLGARPAQGRDFSADDDTPARWRVVVISDGLWRRRFNADATIVGRVLRMNDQDYQIVGIMPAAFEPLISEHFYMRADIWAALGYDTTLPYACRDCQHLKVLGRLRPGVTVAAAEADMNRVHAELRSTFPSAYPPTSTIAIRSLADELSGAVKPALAALMGAVAFVLLIACANVANLLLARMARRQHDLALRSALGASRSRMIRQLLIESAVLALAGGLLGIALSSAAVPLLGRLTPVTISRLDTARVDAVVLAYGLGIALATTLCFGLLPALRASRVDLSGAISADGRRTASPPSSRLRRMLIAVDVALAVVLLAGAGLMIRSVATLLGVNPGFDPQGVLSMQISMVGSRYAEDNAVVRTGDAMLDGLRTLPGVVGVAVAGQIPLGGNGDTWGFHVVGRPASPDDPSVERYSVTPDYFSVMRIPLRRGRLIADRDRAGAERVMVLGEHTARSLWPNEDPIGQHVRIGGTSGPTYTIVGIVGDVRHHELAKPPTLQMYLSQRQLTDSFPTVVIRTTGDPLALATAARRAIWSIASDVPVYQVASLEELVAKSVGPRRFMMLLLELFGVIALLMTAIGVYGVIAYSVAERTREIGVRAALGASRMAIARLVIGSGLVVVLAGLVVGSAMAFAATRYLESSLFGVSPSDPLTFASVIGVLLSVTLAAQAIPVLRAMRVDPAVALRQE